MKRKEGRRKEGRKEGERKERGKARQGRAGQGKERARVQQEVSRLRLGGLRKGCLHCKTEGDRKEGWGGGKEDRGEGERWCSEHDDPVCASLPDAIYLCVVSVVVTCLQ